jgi:hypothetical protein
VEKLSQPKYGLDFLVASLGKVENKEEFIKSQTGELPDISSWKVSAFREAELRKEIKRIEKGLKTYFESQARVAELIEQEAELRYQMELKDEVQQHNVKLPSGSLSSLYKLLLWYDEEIQKAKAEAIREFVERLKKKTYPFPCAIGVENAVTVRGIYDLLEEMVGDT